MEVKGADDGFGNWCSGCVCVCVCLCVCMCVCGGGGGGGGNHGEVLGEVEGVESA